jgi:hypothetical protein
MYNKALKYHKKAKKSISDFWETILMSEDSDRFDIGLILNHISQMEYADAKANGAYRRMVVRFPLSVKVLKHYAVFLSEIHHNREDSDEILERIKKICQAGLSDDPNTVSHPGAPARSPSENRIYSEYREKIYDYSKKNSSQFNWIIRGMYYDNLLANSHI